jgi:hypothetical protein
MDECGDMVCQDEKCDMIYIGLPPGQVIDLLLLGLESIGKSKGVYKVFTRGTRRVGKQLDND